MRQSPRDSCAGWGACSSRLRHCGNVHRPFATRRKVPVQDDCCLSDWRLSVRWAGGLSAGLGFTVSIFCLVSPCLHKTEARCLKVDDQILGRGAYVAGRLGSLYQSPYTLYGRWPALHTADSLISNRQSCECSADSFVTDRCRLVQPLC